MGQFKDIFFQNQWNIINWESEQSINPWTTSLGTPFSLFNILPPNKIIYLFDNPVSFRLLDNDQFVEYYSENNKLVFGLPKGNYTLQIKTKSEGIYEIQFQIDAPTIYYIIEIIKLDADFKIIRINEDNNPIEDEIKNTFVSTDEIKILLKFDFDDFNGLDLKLLNDVLNKEKQFEIKCVNDVNEEEEFKTGNFESDFFSFLPLEGNREAKTDGSRSPNKPIRNIVSITYLGLKKSILLEQDEIDILRQEYIDYNTKWIPDRNNIELNDIWNTGNYNYIATESEKLYYDVIWKQLNNKWNNLLNEWNDLKDVKEEWDDLEKNCFKRFKNGDDLSINTSSTYRNPQRNKAIGSKTINSYHTRGRAMDVIFNNNDVGEDCFYCLREIAKEITKPSSITPHCDCCGSFVDDCSRANHIHIQW